jgi:hypothetical protein
MQKQAKTGENAGWHRYWLLVSISNLSTARKKLKMLILKRFGWLMFDSEVIAWFFRSSSRDTLADAFHLTFLFSS